MIPNAPEPRLDHLYQEVILDHNRSPRNFKKIEHPTAYAHGYNPICGDDYHVYLLLDKAGTIQDIGFQGNGCAISKASASMMTSLLKGKNKKEADTLKESFVEMMTSEHPSSEVKGRIGRLTLFEGVREFPVRVKCATIAWHALADALKDLPNS